MLRFRRWPQLGSAGCCAVEGAGLPCWASGRAACGSPSLLAFSTVGAKSCGLAHSGSAGFEGRMGAAGACARMRSICSLKFSPRALRPMTCPPRRVSCSIWLARKPSRGAWLAGFARGGSAGCLKMELITHEQDQTKLAFPMLHLWRNNITHIILEVMKSFKDIIWPFIIRH